MELKDYQSRVLADLTRFLDTLQVTPHLSEAFRQHWADKGVRVGHSSSADAMAPYKNTVPGVPHVCAKVPTAGGKTYIAVNALAPIFAALSRSNPRRPQLVVWLVPSLTILEQTVKALGDPAHPYRRRLDVLFRHRVVVYEKRDLLMGAGFSHDVAQAQLSIVVMSFDSLRARNKEDRKIFQENGNLASFLSAPAGDPQDWLLPDYDPSALINVIRRLKPVVVVDESHNAESQLSVEMMTNLNPDFIFDLTATPRNNSNIISYVDALALKKRHMVKLPVIVANRASKAEVIESALILRQQLEDLAQQEEARGGNYVRPIVLFQAQPRSADDNTTFEKIRAALLALKVPPEQVAIKTADINELKSHDLMSRACPVRYIITVNALKEGWDCPFAYILATLADKNSSIDVEQILGRVLRMPHVQQHGADLLNLSYVFTASNRFLDTLKSVVQGLNRAGFSDRDYRAMEATVDLAAAVVPGAAPAQASGLFDAPLVLGGDEIDIRQIAPGWDAVNQAATGIRAGDAAPGAAFVAQITQQALTENQAFEAQANTSTSDVPPELESKMNRHKMKELFRAEVQALRLPQFFIKVESGGWFDESESLQLFEREALLKDFKLSQADASIGFDDVEAEMYRVDLEQMGSADYSPKAFKLNVRERSRFNDYILSLPPESVVMNVVNRLLALIGNIVPISDPEVKTYLLRIVEAMAPEQLRDCLERDVSYARKIKQKIATLADLHAQKVFIDLLDLDKVTVQASFALPEAITPGSNASAIPKSLYVTEAAMGDFERRVMNDIANLDSVQWWHRNLSRGKGFRINGYLNHYPDFLVKTKAGRLVLLETKGDDRDNSDSELKLKLGKLWEAKAGGPFRYMMLFDNNPVNGAERLSDALRKLAQL